MIFKNLDQLNQVLPAKGRLMALDVGTKRIGIALADDSRFIATPKLVLTRRSNRQDFAEINKFITDHHVSAIIIGRPIQMDETETPMTRFSDKFSQSFDEFLENKFPIFLFEERLTSFEARNPDIADLSRSRKKKFIDDIAASFILQHFLDDIAIFGE